MTTLKCANCDNPAGYSLVDPGVNPVDYCDSCIPEPFRARAGRGEMTLRVVTEITPQPEPEPQAQFVVDGPEEPEKATKKVK